MIQVLIHITDAPCHGSQYHDYRDNYPTGDPAGITPHELMERVWMLNINYWFGYVDKSATEKMVQEFSKMLQNASGRELKIEKFDATDPTSIEEMVYDSITTSISLTKSSMMGTKTPIRNYSIDETPTNWSKLLVRDACRTPPVPTSSVTEGHIKLPNIPMKIKLCSNPFAEGVGRLAYHALDVTTNNRYVVKEFKRMGKKENSIKHYMQVYETQVTAAMYTSRFNLAKPAHVPQINFVSPGVLNFMEHDRPKYYAIEPYIEGKYKKFNNNNGWVAGQSAVTDANQAFSHFTWVNSKKLLVVCDLQGVETDEGILLTDPAIHSKKLLKFEESTNHGAGGIKKFFDSHKCTDVCRAMSLEAYN